MPSEQDILQALRQVEDPDLHRDIVTLGFVRDVEMNDGRVTVRVVLTTPACPVRTEMKAQIEEILRGLPGVNEAEATMDAEVRTSAASSIRPCDTVPHAPA